MVALSQFTFRVVANATSAVGAFVVFLMAMIAVIAATGTKERPEDAVVLVHVTCATILTVATLALSVLGLERLFAAPRKLVVAEAVFLSCVMVSWAVGTALLGYEPMREEGIALMALGVIVLILAPSEDGKLGVRSMLRSAVAFTLNVVVQTGIIALIVAISRSL